MKKNLYDNQIFFNKYKFLRQDKNCANNLVEKPKLFSMLPNIKGKSVLDLGCGYGDYCMEYLQMGAKKVVGIDISEKMINEAKKRYGNSNINFLILDIEKLDCIKEKFDLVVSSLAIHYVKEFNLLCENVFEILNCNGYFLFSQEHPIFTSPKNGALWIKDTDNGTIGMLVSDYPYNGARNVQWLGCKIKKHHRTISKILNSLISSKFLICKIEEPIIEERLIALSPSLSRCRHIPDYLFVLAKKVFEKD